jgi:hypothetical protein
LSKTGIGEGYTVVLDVFSLVKMIIGEERKLKPFLNDMASSYLILIMFAAS